MMSEASESELRLRERIEAGGFAVALSGGGHRATLATLGALMALVDRNLGNKILQISSVSGGTITNAFVAQRCSLEELAPGGLDGIAKELAGTIIRKGVLTWRWFIFIVLACCILGAVGGWLFHTLVGQPMWPAVLVGSIVALSAFLARGVVIEWLLDRRYFRHGPQAKACGRALLSSLAKRRIDHVFCMTDLTLGLPVYASSSQNGYMWRRLKPEFHALLDTFPQFQTFAAPDVSIAELVRASAAFPGIPPRRMRIPPDPAIELVAELPAVAYLADGGIWNNLGTQVLREDQFLGNHGALDHGIPRPYGIAPGGIPLLCINGSAPLRPARAWCFKWPVCALLKSLWQVMEILNANTVLPRVDASRRALKRRRGADARPDFLDPADLIVDLGEVETARFAYLEDTWTPELIRKSDPAIRKWERDALIRMRVAREHANQDSETNWLDYLLGAVPEPGGSYPVCGLASIDDWDALWASPHWQQLVLQEGTGQLDAPTTLGRIEPALARRLIARGYLNTYLVSLFLAPLAEGELGQLATLGERFDSITGTTPAPQSQTAGSASH